MCSCVLQESCWNRCLTFLRHVHKRRMGVFRRWNRSSSYPWNQLVHHRSRSVSSSGWNRRLVSVEQVFDIPLTDLYRVPGVWYVLLVLFKECYKMIVVWTHIIYFWVWQQHWISVDSATASVLLIFRGNHNRLAWALYQKSCLIGRTTRGFPSFVFLVFSRRDCGVCQIHFYYSDSVLWTSASFMLRKRFLLQTDYDYFVVQLASFSPRFLFWGSFLTSWSHSVLIL